MNGFMSASGISNFKVSQAKVYFTGAITGKYATVELHSSHTYGAGTVLYVYKNGVLAASVADDAVRDVAFMAKKGDVITVSGGAAYMYWTVVQFE